MAPYRLGVGTTGVIFAAIAVAWLAYLVPHFVRRRDDDELLQDSDPADRFSTRCASSAMARLRFLIRTSKRSRPSRCRHRRPGGPRSRVCTGSNGLPPARRRHVLLALMAALSAVVGMCAAHLIPWWSAAIPGGLLLIFVVVARISVRIMLRGLDARYREIRHGNDESTIFLSRKDFAKLDALAHAASGTADAAAKPGVLWDPIPITMPTYVSKPLAPRTVRTIDLSGPGASSSAGHEGPVTADAPDSASDSPPADAGGESRKVASA